MDHYLKQILELESARKYDDAYLKYQKLISKNDVNFDIWKHYFFFLWSMIEDVDGIFTEKLDLNFELQNELKNGFEKYTTLAEFNFIVGYTISIFPYQFGDYEDLSVKGRDMLKKSTELDPDNSIYKMIFLGSQQLNKKEQVEYQDACLKSQPKVVSDFSGNGLLNEYFFHILNRDGKKIK